MTSDRVARIEALCLEALSKAGGDRAAFLDEACHGDDQLRREVESLLAGRTQAEVLLERPAFAPVSTSSGIASQDGSQKRSRCCVGPVD